MSLTPEQNAAWCRKCIALINGDDMSNAKSIFAPMDETTIEYESGGLWITQRGTNGTESIYIPDRYIDLFRTELNRVVESA